MKWAVIVLPTLLAFACAQVKYDNGVAKPQVKVVGQITRDVVPKCKVIGKPLDLVFLVDSSTSLLSAFDQTKEVMKRIISHVAVGSEVTRVALVQFSRLQRTDFQLNELTYSKAVKQAIDNLRPRTGLTKIGAALQYVKGEFDTNKGMRGPEVPKILFLLSDGKSNDYPLDTEMAEVLKKTIPNLRIWAYGLGDYVDLKALSSYTGSEKTIITSKNLDQIEPLFGEFKGEEVCEEVPRCEIGSDKPLDLLVILDGSESVDRIFKAQKQFVIDRILNYTYLGPSAVRFGLINYGSNVKVEMMFGEVQRIEPLIRDVTNLEQLNGTTSTDKAINQALSMYTDPERYGGRAPEKEVNKNGLPIARVAVLLHDGFSGNDPTRIAERLRKIGVVIFAIAIHDDADKINLRELETITGDKRRVFTNKNLDTWEKSFTEFTGAGCAGEENGATVAPGTAEIEVENPVQITCTGNSLTYSIKTKHPFSGSLFVPNYVSDPTCVVKGNGKDKFVSITIQRGRCGMAVDADLDGLGAKYTVPISTQFHPDVLTVIDMTKEVECLVKDTSFAQDPPSSSLAKLDQLQCRYTLHRNEPKGCIMLDASVGEMAYHRWTCLDYKNDVLASNIKYLVHDCKAYAFDRKPLEFLDSNGCAVDDVLMETPHYFKSSGPDFVWQRHFAFKWVDVEEVKFECKISLCDMETGPAQCKEHIGKMIDDAKARCAELRGTKLVSRARRAIDSSTKPGYQATYTVKTRYLNLVLSATLTSVFAGGDQQYCVSY